MTTLAPTASRVLLEERARAERRLNGVRAIVIIVLAVAAAVYAPALSPRLNAVNAMVLGPMLGWTIAQHFLFRNRALVPDWLGIVNPVADTTAITVTMAGYGLVAGPALALKSPLVLTYFAVLASRQIVTSTRRAAAAAVFVVAAYASLDVLFILIEHIPLSDPVTASRGAAVSLLDEGAKLTFLAAAGAIATYATWWHERLALRYSHEMGEREALRARLASAQLDSLKQQLQPHFLFNALNAISALVDTDPPAAQRMISGLGELIRVSLDAGATQEVALQRELEVLAHYVAIQRIRFGERLTIAFDVDDATRDALVPTLILQPLVENAIKYGLGKFAAPARIEVRARREDAALVLEVEDDGPGVIGTPEALVERVGIGNARARLTHLYGERHTFTVESPPSGGFRVGMRIPYRTTSAPADGARPARKPLEESLT